MSGNILLRNVRVEIWLWIQELRLIIVDITPVKSYLPTLSIRTELLLLTAALLHEILRRKRFHWILIVCIIFREIQFIFIWEPKLRLFVHLIVWCWVLLLRIRLLQFILRLIFWLKWLLRLPQLLLRLQLLLWLWRLGMNVQLRRRKLLRQPQLWL